MQIEREHQHGSFLLHQGIFLALHRSRASSQLKTLTLMMTQHEIRHYSESTINISGLAIMRPTYEYNLDQVGSGLQLDL